MGGEGRKVARVDALLWGGFSVGGFIAALFMPFLIVYVLLATLGLFPEYFPNFPAWDKLQLWLANPLAKLFVGLVFIGTIYHGLHRVKYIIYDYGGHNHPVATAAVTYGIVAMAALVVFFILLPSPF